MCQIQKFRVDTERKSQYASKSATLANWPTMLIIISLSLSLSLLNSAAYAEVTEKFNCTKGCCDENEHCSFWASRHECANNSDWMADNCQLSCKTCRANSTGKSPIAEKFNCTNGCCDENEHCSFWASRHECANNSDWMSENCQLSCNTCGMNNTNATKSTTAPSAETFTIPQFNAELPTPPINYTFITGSCGETSIYPVSFEPVPAPFEPVESSNATFNDAPPINGADGSGNNDTSVNPDFGEGSTENSTGGGVSAQMVGGFQSIPHSLPSIVSVRYGIGEKRHICGGTLVRVSKTLDQTDIVITAAHCNNDGKIKTRDMEVAAGKHDITLDDEVGEQTAMASKFITHEQYDRKRHVNDIAIIKLAKPLTFTKDVQPACLPPKGERLSDDTRFLAAGWGQLAENKYESSAKLQQLALPLITNKQCNDFYKKATPPENIDAKVEFCAGYPSGNKDSCQGDSGGPLFAKFEDKFFLEGIISHGTGCARANFPGIYTKVSAFSDWINQKIGELSDIANKTAENTGRSSDTHPNNRQRGLVAKESNVTVAKRPSTTPVRAHSPTKKAPTTTKLPKHPHGQSSKFHNGSCGQTELDPMADFDYYDSDDVNTEKKSLNDHGTDHEDDDNDNDQEEEQEEEEHQEAVPNSIPWIVSIQRGIAKKDHFCEGVLLRVNPNVEKTDIILTAARCYNKKWQPSLLQVVAGEHNLHESDPEEQTKGVEKLVKHEEFDPVNMANDIAIIKLTEPVTFGKSARPVCLPRLGEKMPKNMTFLVAGWGYSDEDKKEMFDRLQQRQEILVDLNKCKKHYKKGQVTATLQICTDLRKSREVKSCEADIGMPIFAKSERGFVLQGISTNLEGCTKIDTLRVYTRVSSYVTWINGKIAELSDFGQKEVLKPKAIDTGVSPKRSASTAKARRTTPRPKRHTTITTTEEVTETIPTTEKGNQALVGDLEGSQFERLVEGNESSTAAPDDYEETTASGPKNTTEDDDIGDSSIPVGSCGHTLQNPLSQMVKQNSSGRIVGGKDAPPNSLPWIVSIQRGGGINNRAHICGGTLIRVKEGIDETDLILTAAHCDKGWDPSTHRIVAGVNTLYKPNAYLQLADAVKIVKHENYSRTTMYNDIAVIKLNQTIKFTKTTQPACLPKQGHNVASGSEGIVAGWGALNDTDKEVSNKLQLLVIPVFPDDKCKTFFKDDKIKFNEIVTFCAGNEMGGEDSCQGDSGGPVVFKIGNTGYTLEGVVSRGSTVGCAKKSLPGIYTRVSNYVDWINGKIKELSDVAKRKN